MPKTTSPVFMAACLLSVLSACKALEPGPKGSAEPEDIPQVITNLNRLPPGMRTVATTNDPDSTPRHIAALADYVYFTAIASADKGRLVYRYQLGTSNPPQVLPVPDWTQVFGEVKGNYRSPDLMLRHGDALVFRAIETSSNRLRLFQITDDAADPLPYPAGADGSDLQAAWSKGNTLATVWQKGGELMVAHQSPTLQLFRKQAFAQPILQVRGLCEPEDKVAAFLLQTGTAAASTWHCWLVDLSSNQWRSQNHGATQLDLMCAANKLAFYGEVAGANGLGNRLWCATPAAATPFQEIKVGGNSITNWSLPIEQAGKLFFRRIVAGQHELWQSDGGSCAKAPLGGNPSPQVITGVARIALAVDVLCVLGHDLANTRTMVLLLDGNGTTAADSLVGVTSPRTPTQFWTGFGFLGRMVDQKSGLLKPAIARWGAGIWTRVIIEDCVDDAGLAGLLGCEHGFEHELVFAGTHTAYGNELWRWRGQ